MKRDPLEMAHGISESLVKKTARLDWSSHDHAMASQRVAERSSQ